MYIPQTYNVQRHRYSKYSWHNQTLLNNNCLLQQMDRMEHLQIVFLSNRSMILTWLCEYFMEATQCYGSYCEAVGSCEFIEKESKDVRIGDAVPILQVLSMSSTKVATANVR